jgi:hypothetical protein
MRQVKLLSDALLNPTQRMLLKFQRKNVLDSESSGNESDVIEQDAVELINHKNVLI